MNELRLHTARQRFPYHGTLSSAQLTEIIEAITHDLTAIITSLNEFIVPLIRSLPGGAEPPTITGRTHEINPIVNGLDGSQLYVDSTTVDTNNPVLYNALQSRPNTIKEALEYIAVQVEKLRRQVG